MILVPFLMFMVGTSSYVRADTSDKEKGNESIHQTLINSNDKSMETSTNNDIETVEENGEGEVANPEETSPPEGEAANPEETSPPEGEVTNPEETPPPEGEVINPGEILPPEEDGYEIVPDRKDYTEISEDDVPEEMRIMEMMQMLITSIPGTVEVNKTATPVEGCRTYEIELEILGTPPPAKPLDVVLVIDKSESMNNGNVLADAKNAAITFAETILSNTNNRVAVVSYSGAYPGDDSDAKLNKSLTNNYTQVENAILGITANGGTNTQSGFRKAKSELQKNGRSAANKAIVLLSDGVANLSTSSQYYDNWPTNHNDHTRNAYLAGQDAQSISQVFTIGLFDGIIANQPPNQRPYTTLWVAQDTLRRAAQAGNYFDSPDSSYLKQIYEKIANVMNYSATSATVTDIVSPEVIANFDIIPGSMVSSQGSFSISGNTISWVPGTIGTEATLKYIIKAKENYEGSNNLEIPTNTSAILTYTDINGVPNNKKTFPVPKIIVPAPLRVNAGEDIVIGLGEYAVLGGNPALSGGFTPYSEIKWTVEDIVVSNELNPKLPVDANSTYTLTVKDKYGCTRSDSVNVTVVKGEITIIKRVIDKNGNIISDSNEFAINVNGALTKNLPENRIPSINWNLFLKGNGEGKIFRELPLRQYNISEIYKPVGYKVVSIQPSSVTLTKSSHSAVVIVTNQIEEKGWFTDVDEKDNYFGVSKATSNSEGKNINVDSLKDIVIDEPKEEDFEGVY